MDEKLMEIISTPSAFLGLKGKLNSELFSSQDQQIEIDCCSDSSSKEDSESQFESLKAPVAIFPGQNAPQLQMSPLYKLVSKMSGTQKRVYFCQRCLNHGRHEPRKNHKCDCPFATCTCEKCILVEKRRVLNTQLHELEEIGDGDADSADSETMSGGRTKGERVPNCQKCGQHGRKSRLKGHKRVCPFKDCGCPKCAVVTERQKLMADQIKIRRRQRKDTIMNLTRENITATLNAVNAFSTGQNFGNLNFNNLNAALLYNQMKTQIPGGLMTSPSQSSDSSAYSPPVSISNLIVAPQPKQHSPADLTSMLFQVPTSATTSLPAPTPLQMPMMTMPPQSPTPPTPSTAGLIAPVAINPVAVSQASSFPFPLLSATNEQLLQSLLSNYKLLTEQKLLDDQTLASLQMCIPSETLSSANPIIDVCSV